MTDKGTVTMSGKELNRLEVPRRVARGEAPLQHALPTSQRLFATMETAS